MATPPQAPEHRRLVIGRRRMLALGRKARSVTVAIAATSLLAIGSVTFALNSQNIVQAFEPDPEVVLLTASDEIDGARAIVDVTDPESGEIEGCEPQPNGAATTDGTETASTKPAASAPVAVIVETEDDSTEDEEVYNTLVNNTYLGRAGARELMGELDADAKTDIGTLAIGDGDERIANGGMILMAVLQDGEQASEASKVGGATTHSDESDSDVGSMPLPTSAHGSAIDSLTLSWSTPDTVDDGNATNLHLVPSGNSKISARMKMRYAFSGQSDYAPGTITFTIPAHVYYDRNGRSADTMILPVPESPSDRGTWNYTLSGDTYKITNVRSIKANTKGYMEFLASGILPSSIADMSVSGHTSAACEITLASEDTIGASTGELTSTIDTDAKVTDATIRSWTSPQIVSASSVPQAVKNAAGTNDAWYVLVRWYSTGYVALDANTEYVLSVTASTADGYNGYFSKTASNSQLDAVTTGGFANPKTVNVSNNQTSVYYPLSQFSEGVNYSFKANATYSLATTDAPGSPSIASNAATYSNWSYHTPRFNDTGNFAQHWNIGNSKTSFGSAGGLLSLKNERALNYDGEYEDTVKKYSDLSVPYGWETDAQTGYHGRYKSALNDLRDGNDVVIGFTTRALARPIALTYQGDGTENSVRKVGNYGIKTTSTAVESAGLHVGDPTLSGSRKLVAGADYEIAAVSIPSAPSIGKPFAVNVDENGNYVNFGQDMYISYTNDNDKTHIPDIVVSATVAGVGNVRVATVSYKTGTSVITCENGASIDKLDATRIVLPRGTTYVQSRTVDNACVMIDYRMRTDYRVMAASENVSSIVTGSFNGAYAPVLSFFDTSRMQVFYGADQGDNANKQHFEKARQGYDELCGYTTDTRAMFDTDASFDVANDNDSELSISTVHYSATMTVQSFIEDDELYSDAIEKGKIATERTGTFYELLPKGMILDQTSVSLDNGGIKSLSVKHDWRGSGRDLVIVKASIVPAVSIHDEGAAKYRCQAATLSFTCAYPYAAQRDYGENTHIVSAYRSDNASIGSVDGYRGECDNPSGTNNLGTSSAFANGSEGDEEKAALAGLGAATLGTDDSASPIYLYAGCAQAIDVISAAEIGVKKYVMVNSDGQWSSGTETVADGSLLRRDAYVGGTYSYRLVAAPSMEGTEVSGLVFYDSLENASEPNDDTNIDDPEIPFSLSDETSWRGVLAGVDVSALRVAGVDAQIYYSGRDDLVFSGDADNTKNDENCNLSSVGGIWISHDEWISSGKSLSDVKAIAVDASKKTDGSEYTIAEGDEASVIVRMKSPLDVSAFSSLSEAFALNTMFATGITTDTNTHAANAFAIESNHTKVGLKEHILHVEITWDDDGDRDGKRPDSSIEYEIIADGKPTGEAVTITNGGGWAADVVLSPVDENGDEIAYTFEPRKTDGSPVSETGFDDDYSETLAIGETEDGGTTVTVTERHEPEKTSITGQKTWSGDTAEVRPGEITLVVTGDDGSTTEKVIKGTNATNASDDDGSGDGTQDASDDSKTASGSADFWAYEISGLNKYYNHGTEISYTVTEKPDSAASYIHSANGTTITNEYHPYGTLVIETHTQNATTKALEKKFSYVISVTDPNGGEDDDYKEEMHGHIIHTDANGNETSRENVTVESGGTIEVGHGDRLVLDDVPEYYNYSIYQHDLPGFENVHMEGNEGSITPNKTSTASFVNSYSSSTDAVLTIGKRLDGRKLTSHKFVFDAKDASGNVVKSAFNNGAAVQTGEDGSVFAEESFSFSAISYDESDDGKTYEYRVSERQENAPGYSYDDSEYAAKVTLSDNGDGTMSSSVSWTKADGTTPLDDGTAYPTFHNVYNAEGELTLEAVKKLSGGTLSDGMFTFELYRAGIVGSISSDGTVDTSCQDLKSIEVDDIEPIATASNDATGRVTFPAVKFGSADANKVIRFFMMEENDKNPNYEYDEHISVVDVYAYDDNKGSIKFTTNYDIGETECPACGGNTPEPPAINVLLDEADNGGYPWTMDENGVYSSTNSGVDSSTSTIKIKTSVKEPMTIMFDYAGSGEGGSSYCDYVCYTVDSGDSQGKTNDTTSADDIKWHSARVELQPGEHVICISYTKDISLSSYADKAWVKNIQWEQKQCHYCGGTGKLSIPESSYVFNNTLIPGKLAIQKVVDEDVDEGQTFKFQVDIKNADGKPVDIDITQVKYEEKTGYAIVTSERTLVFVKRIVEPSLGDTISIEWEDGTITQEHIAKVYSGFDQKDYSPPTDDYGEPSTLWSGDGVEKAIFLDEFSAYNTASWFCGMSNVDFLEKLDTSNVTNMWSMFSGCGFTIVDVSNFDTHNVVNMQYMFAGCTNLVTIYVGPRWSHASLQESGGMFFECYDILGGKGDGHNMVAPEHGSYQNSAIMCRKYFTPKINVNYRDNDGNITKTVPYEYGIKAENEYSLVLNGDANFSPNSTILYDWDNEKDDTNWRVYDIDLYPVNKHAFAIYSDDDKSLRFYKRDVVPKAGEHFAERTVTDVYQGVESDIYSWTTPWDAHSSDILSAYVEDPDIRPISTSFWFYHCTKMTTVSFSKIDTTRLTNVYGMFYGTSSLATIELIGFDTNKVTDLSGMFYGACITDIDLSPLDTSNVMYMNDMFDGCTKLSSINLSSIDLSSVLSMCNMFSGCSSLSALAFPPIGSARDTRNVQNMSGMFLNCSSLTSIESLSLNTGSVTDMSNMFSNCSSLTSIESLSLNTSSVTDMSNMFSNCRKLENINLLQTDLKNVTNMWGTFRNCATLKNVRLPSIDVSNVTSMQYMFEKCQSLESIDLSPFDMSNVQYMDHMFSQCSTLSKVKISSGTKNYVVNGMDYMFNECPALIELDLSSFDTRSATGIKYMFANCSSLATIYIGPLWSVEHLVSSYESDYMFKGCTSLVGGKGTTFNASWRTDGYLARADEPDNGNHGYMTYKESDADSSTKGVPTQSMGFSSIKVQNPQYKTGTGITPNSSITLPLYGENTLSASGTDMLFAADASNDSGLISLSAVSLPASGELDGGEVAWEIDDDGNMTIIPKDPSGGTITKSSSLGIASNWEWYDYRSKVTSVRFAGPVSINTASEMFSDFSKMTYIDLSNLDTSGATSMNKMFCNCSNLTNINLSSFVTDNVTDMSSMFAGCADLSDIDASNFDTSKVRNMISMFSGCSSLSSLDVSSFDTSNVGSMSYMLSGCSNLRAIKLGLNETNNFKKAIGSPTNLTLVYAGESGTDYDATAYSGTLSNLLSTYDGTRPGWYKTDPNITITYNKNSTTAIGTMTTQAINCDEPATLNKNTYTNPNKIFTGWATTASGYPTYKNGATIAPNTVVANTTLYATWKDIVTINKIGEGSYEIEIPANYRVTLEDLLPAGTSYTVTEILDVGWTIQSSENATGVIAPNETTVASFTNVYTPTTTQASLSASKTIDSMLASTADAYSFTLHDITASVLGAEGASTSGTEFQTVSVSDGGHVVFDAMCYGEGDIGEHYYRIDENAGTDAKVDFDESARYAKVTVNKGPDNVLSASTEYLPAAPSGQVMAANDGTFKNRHKPGSLTVNKTVSKDSLSDGTATDFDVEITLMRNGKLLIGSVTVDGRETLLNDGKLTVPFKGGESATVADIPDGCSYSITETDPSGWSVVTDIPLTGTVSAGETSEVSVESTYSANGFAYITPKVTLEGRLMEADEFSCELSGGSGSPSVAYNAGIDLDDYAEGTDFANMISEIGFPSVSFDSLGEHPFTVKQVIPDDAVNENDERWADVKNEPDAREHTWRYENVTYDASVKHVTLNVTDSGDGTLSAAVSFADGDDTFRNVYIAPVELPFSGETGIWLLVALGTLLIVTGTLSILHSGGASPSMRRRTRQ